MSFLRKRRVKITTFVLGATALIASSAAATIYKITSETSKYSDFIIDPVVKPELISKDNLDLNNTTNSNRDNNLKPLPEPEPKPIVPVEPIDKPEPPIINPVEPEPKPIEPPKPLDPPKPEPKPTPKPQPVPKPSEPKPSAGEALVEIAGVLVKAKVKNPPSRITFEYDRQNGLANREEYIAEIAGDIISVEVTDELRNKVVNDALSKVKNDRDNPSGYIGTLKEILKQYDNNYNKIEEFMRIQPDNWRKILDRYRRIIESPNVVDFLVAEAVPQYPEIMKHPSKEYRELWLINNLDFSKFTKLAADGEKFLKEGLVLDPENAYINERGEWSSYSWSPPDKYNGTKAELSRNNNEKRAFDYDSYYWRNPGDIEKGVYSGWTKKKITDSEEFKKYNISKISGIGVYELTRDTPAEGKLNRGVVVEIDAASDSAYARTKSLIEELKNDKVDITSYRIFNMGKKSSSQKFKDILETLPDELPQLELFFDASATNTSSLIALEHKKIKELSLYTKGNSLLDAWSINPWSLKETAWVNTADYNVSFDHPSNTDIPTRITFNSLAFEESDYLPNSTDPYKRINDGLRMAYYTRNNEKIFQGGMGPGLKPDHDEGSNSYPTGLDLSRAKSLRSLKGLKFHDEFKPSNKARKLKRLVLYNSTDSFDISSSELNVAGFNKHIVMGEMEKSKILFSNGNSTKYVYIKGFEKLSSDGISNLSILIDLAEGLKKEIKVDSASSELANQLINAGYSVIEAGGDDDYINT